MAHDAWLRRPQKFGVRRGVYLGTTEQLAGPVALRQCVEHFTGAAFEVVGLQPAAEGRPLGRVFVAAPMEVFPLNWKCEWCGPARPPAPLSPG